MTPDPQISILSDLYRNTLFSNFIHCESYAGPAQLCKLQQFNHYCRLGGTPLVLQQEPPWWLVQHVALPFSFSLPVCTVILSSSKSTLIMTASRPWQKKRALKGSESFKACFELYRCINPEKSFKSSFKKYFLAFSHDFCSTIFWVVAWVQVELRSLSSFRRCMLFDWLLLLLLLFKLTGFSRDCVQGWWDPSSNVCFSAMADCIIAKSRFQSSFKML